MMNLIRIMSSGLLPFSGFQKNNKLALEEVIFSLELHFAITQEDYKIKKLT